MNNLTIPVAVTSAALWMLMLFLFQNHAQAEATRFLIHDGQVHCVVVIADDAPQPVREAAQLLVHHWELATGQPLSILTPGQASDVSAETLLLLVGPSEMTRALGVDGSDLPLESYRLKTAGRALVFLGDDYPAPGVARESKLTESATTLWAVVHFLDHALGARWLWPGELGTHVPRTRTLALPDWDVTRQPPLLKRRLRLAKGAQHPSSQGDASDAIARRREANQWLQMHQAGARDDYRLGHAFTDWWAMYHREHRDYFATPPQGKAYADMDRRIDPRRHKLCVSNEAVDQAIIARWQAAGAPDSWGVCPNDGGGFCVCPDCMAMDFPQGQDPVDIWRARGELTVRYVTFWNRLIRKMRRINPKVELTSYAYGAYRNPPPAGVKLEPGMVLGIVCAYTPQAMEEWDAWRAAGAELLLRPNWWHTGGGAPHLPLHAMGDFFSHARERGMKGFDFDSIVGHWGTQGVNYYLIARMAARPDLSVDQVIAEYTSAFGSAAPAVARYLAYWEEFTTRSAYVIPAGGGVSQNPDGAFERIVREHGLSHSPLLSGWQVIPYLYTDQVLDEARAILAEAQAALPPDETQAIARVRFLQQGLAHFRLTRDVLRLGYADTRPAGATAEDFARLSDRLMSLRRSLTAHHVIWGEQINHEESRRGIPTAPGRVPWTDTDGM